MLNVNEIFRSIDGEVNYWGQGSLTTFIRLQGCNFCCDYCDTKQTRSIKSEKHIISIEQIIDIIPTGKITITGGEPLLQKETPALIEALLNEGHAISVETNGSIPIPAIASNNLSWIIDYKLHNFQDMHVDNFWNASSRDWIKFMIADITDFYKALLIADIFVKGGEIDARIAFSPVMQNNDMQFARWLAEEIIEKHLWHITLNLQIHKLIWSDKPEGIQLL